MAEQVQPKAIGQAPQRQPSVIRSHFVELKLFEHELIGLA